jgi:hypothetical protein
MHSLDANERLGRYVKEWFNASPIAFADYEFDAMKQELLVVFDKLDEEFDRIFDHDLKSLSFQSLTLKLEARL